jgi:hypothetical protein
MGKEIEEISKSRSDFNFDSKRQMIPCFAHVLNIVCQDMLSKGLQSSAPDTTSDDVYTMKQSMEKRDEQLEQREQNQGTITEKRSPINKLRRGCIKIK